MQKCVNKCTYIIFWERQKYNKTKLRLIKQSNRPPTLIAYDSRSFIVHLIWNI